MTGALKKYFLHHEFLIFAASLAGLLFADIQHEYVPESSLFQGFLSLTVAGNLLLCGEKWWKVVKDGWLHR
ncbi:hypothetical protein LJC48_02825 [Desulfovibrio sp. OttesenSCG-928-C06]|nr:hypothetical protein [Desulfovibrio sp. OttesenSCG-928-C06]